MFTWMISLVGNSKDNCLLFHNQLHPQRQVQLLILWDFISCPYNDKKQEHRVTLKIIGFWVNSLIRSISLSPDSITDIISKINTFIGTKDHQPPLCDWQKLAGHLNWMLNVLPWGQPALSEIYRKIAGKLHNHAKIFLNATVIDNLTWLAKTIPLLLVFDLLIPGNGQMRKLTSFCGLMQAGSMAYHLSCR